MAECFLIIIIIIKNPVWLIIMLGIWTMTRVWVWKRKERKKESREREGARERWWREDKTERAEITQDAQREQEADGAVYCQQPPTQTHTHTEDWVFSLINAHTFIHVYTHSASFYNASAALLVITLYSTLQPLPLTIRRELNMDEVVSKKTAG